MNLLVSILSRGGPKVSLSGEGVSDTDGTSAQATLRFDQDGNVYKVEGVTETQVDAATDWLRGGLFSLFQIRYTNHTGAALTAATAAEDVWHAMSTSDFSLQLQRNTIGGPDIAQFDIEIRIGTGATIASGAYSLSVTVV